MFRGLLTLFTHTRHRRVRSRVARHVPRFARHLHPTNAAEYPSNCFVSFAPLLLLPIPLDTACPFLRLSRSSLLPKITSCKVSLIACRLACVHPPMDIHLLLVGEKKKKKRRPMDGESYRDDVSVARSLRGFYRGTRKKLAFKWQRECFSGENISFERFFERRKRGGEDPRWS